MTYSKNPEGFRTSIPGTDGMLLLIPEKSDLERDAIASAWIASGGEVLKLGRFWDPPLGLPAGRVRVYGGGAFCMVLAEKLNLSL